MSNQAKLELDGKVFTLPTLVGSENEKAVDVSSLRATTGYITIDDGYGNTGSCVSNITFIDGDQGILRYRGIPIEEMAEKSNFIETAYLIIYGKLPTRAQLKVFSDMLTEYQYLHEDMRYHFEGFPSGAHPMAILSSRFDELEVGQKRAVRRLHGEIDLASAHHRGLFVSQVQRPAVDLSEARLQIHGELFAHDVFAAV
jgi:citrate synthase